MWRTLYVFTLRSSNEHMKRLLWALVALLQEAFRCHLMICKGDSWVGNDKQMHTPYGKVLDHRVGDKPGTDGVCITFSSTILMQKWMTLTLFFAAIISFKVQLSNVYLRFGCCGVQNLVPCFLPHCNTLQMWKMWNLSSIMTTLTPQRTISTELDELPAVPKQAQHTHSLLLTILSK